MRVDLKVNLLKMAHKSDKFIFGQAIQMHQKNFKGTQLYDILWGYIFPRKTKPPSNINSYTIRARHSYI